MDDLERREQLEAFVEDWSQPLAGEYGGQEYESGVEAGRQSCAEQLRELLDQPSTTTDIES